ncbi:putative reverse transcriptase domain-containing protein [Tanacetum coccineum]|uniref:Reverse transcriptase domain-containing protein n=1 Tax=Tanacetum coccineum TaxID=301880 RepID=A0ABQ5FU20_9ASTR
MSVADAFELKRKDSARRVRCYGIAIHSGLKTKILEAQSEASKDLKALAKWLRGLERHFELRDDGEIYFFDRIWIPSVGDVKKLIMDEALINLDFHTIRTRMSKAYHPQTDGQSERTIQTLEDMLRACIMDFGGSWDTHLPLIELSYNNSYHTSIKCAPFEALSRKKSYADKRRKPLEFEVGDRVLLKVSPWKGVVRFGKKGKLAPRYVGPFEIVERVGPVPLDEIEIDENLHFVEEPIEIVERDVKKLKRRRIPLVKVRWNSRQGAEYTWEHENQFRMKYPHIFFEPVLSSSAELEP